MDNLEEVKKQFEKLYRLANLTEVGKEKMEMLWSFIKSQIKQAKIDENKYHKERYRIKEDGSYREPEIFDALTKPYDDRIKQLKEE